MIYDVKSELYDFLFNSTLKERKQACDEDYEIIREDLDDKYMRKYGYTYFCYDDEDND